MVCLYMVIFIYSIKTDTCILIYIYVCYIYIHVTDQRDYTHLISLLLRHEV